MEEPNGLSAGLESTLSSTSIEESQPQALENGEYHPIDQLPSASVVEDVPTAGPQGVSGDRRIVSRFHIADMAPLPQVEIGSSPPPREESPTSSTTSSMTGSSTPEPNLHLRTSSRIKKMPCPMCGGVFFDVEKHAATCEGVGAAVLSSDVAEANDGLNESKKPKRFRVAESSVITPSTTMANKSGSPFSISATSAFSSSSASAIASDHTMTIPSVMHIETPHNDSTVVVVPPTITTTLQRAPGASVSSSKRKRIVPAKSGPSMPPPLGPVPPELDNNKVVIQRERALFAAAAAAAAANHQNHYSARGEKSKNLELVEIEPGVTIFVSEHPMKDGQGQGSEYTLRTQISWLVEELHSVRESDSFVRKENEGLRKQMAEMLVEHEEHKVRVEEMDTLKADLVRTQEQTVLLQQEVNDHVVTIANQDESIKTMKEELRLLRTELSTTKSELSKTKGQCTRAKNEQQKTKTELDEKLQEMNELKRVTEETESRLSKELETLKKDLESKTLETETRTKELESLKKDLESARRELEEMKVSSQHEKPSVVMSIPLLPPVEGLGIVNVDDDDEEGVMANFHEVVDDAYQLMTSVGGGRDAFKDPEDDDSLLSMVDVEEYLILLLDWLRTHKNSIRASAVSVFHGVKPKARELWQRIASSRSPAMTAQELVREFGAGKGIRFDDATESIVLTGRKGGGGEELLMMDFDDYFERKNEEETLRKQREKGFIDRVCEWLEEKNGLARWDEFLDTFPSFTAAATEATAEGEEKLDRDAWLLRVRDEFEEVVFAIPSSSSSREEEGSDTCLVLKLLMDKALTLLFRDYLTKLLLATTPKARTIPASRFAHFLETYPGAKEIKDRMPQGESRLASIARKFPDKIHFWRENDQAMCCLAEDRESIESEKAEKKRREAEAKAEMERQRMEQEKREQEERASQMWERRKEMFVLQQQQQQQQQPNESLPPSVVASAGAPPLAPPNNMTKRQRWGAPVPEAPQPPPPPTTTSNASSSTSLNPTGASGPSSTIGMGRISSNDVVFQQQQQQPSPPATTPATNPIYPNSSSGWQEYSNTSSSSSNMRPPPLIPHLPSSQNNNHHHHQIPHLHHVQHHLGDNNYPYPHPPQPTGGPPPQSLYGQGSSPYPQQYPPPLHPQQQQQHHHHHLHPHQQPQQQQPHPHEFQPVPPPLLPPSQPPHLFQGGNIQRTRF